MPNTRITYTGFFANQMLSDFYSPDRHHYFPMDTADKFRNDEWRVIGNASYAENTREDLIRLSKDNLALQAFIADVIDCMKYNRSMEET